MALKLDKKDRKILSELDMDARQPLTALAKKVGLSREVVNYRISQLEKKKVIQGYVTVLDTAKLGLMYCRMLFKYRKITAAKEKELLEFCNKNAYISWVILGEGKWDIVLVVLAPSMQVIEQVYDELNSGFGEFFQNPYISFALKVHEFKHNYLYEKYDHKELIVGAASTSTKLDGMDKKIIRALSRDARSLLIHLAQTTGSSPKFVSYRIRRLISEKVVLAFRAIINTNLLGYDYYKVFFTLQSSDEQQIKKLFSFMKYHPKVTYITKPIGLHNFEIVAMVKNTNDLYLLLKEFKQKFGNLLVDSDIYFTHQVVSQKYIPM